jgi:hypothetical protein
MDDTITAITGSLDTGSFTPTSGSDYVHQVLQEDMIRGKPPLMRSDRWETVRKHHLETNPFCAACGGSNDLQVHHMHPFHLFPQRELDPTNLITLCEKPLHDGDKADDNHHLTLGHCGDWKNFNQKVLEDVNAYRIGKTKLGELSGYDFKNVARIITG